MPAGMAKKLKKEEEVNHQIHPTLNLNKALLKHIHVPKVLSAFLQHQQTWVDVTETIHQQSLKYWLSGLVWKSLLTFDLENWLEVFKIEDGKNY